MEASTVTILIVAVVNGVIAILTAIGVVWVKIITARQTVAQIVTDKKVTAVAVQNEKQSRDADLRKEDTNARLDDLTETTNAVHTLVNSQMGNQLKVSAVALRQLADQTKGLIRNPGDVKAAELAEMALASHEAKQKIVDDGKKISN